MASEPPTNPKLFVGAKTNNNNHGDDLFLHLCLAQ